MENIGEKIAEAEAQREEAKEKLRELVAAVDQGHETRGSFAQDAAFVIAQHAPNVDEAEMAGKVQRLLDTARNCIGQLVARIEVEPFFHPKTRAKITLGRIRKITEEHWPIRIIIDADAVEFTIDSEARLEDLMRNKFLVANPSNDLIVLGTAEFWKIDDLLAGINFVIRIDSAIQHLIGDAPSDPCAKHVMPPLPSPFDDEEKNIVRDHLLIGNDAVLGLREDGNAIHQNSAYGGLLVREAILCVLLQLEADLPQHPWIAQQLRKFSNKIETRVGTIEAEIAELQSQIEELQSQIHNKRCAIPQFDTRLKDTLKQYLTQSEVEPTAEDSDLVSED